MDTVKIHILPGGKMPIRRTDGAIGFDVFLRAIVSAKEMDEKNPTLRRTLFDFQNLPKDSTIWGNHIKSSEDGLVYRLRAGESVLVGIGFITEMPYPMFYWVAPRSGLASKHGITVTNAPGTVDPDYRGEAGVLVYNRTDHHFDLRHNMRIAQIVFQRAIIPDFEIAESPTELSNTDRGPGGFGSTGLM